MLPGGTIAQLLKQTGTAMISGGHIGPRPDLLQAVGALLGGMSTITGTVTAHGTGLPLDGADVQLLETGMRTTTDVDGNYTLAVTPGKWTIAFNRFGYATDQTSVTTTAGNPTEHHVSLSELEQRSLHGFMVDDEGLPLAGALVYLDGAPLDPVTTNLSGGYRIDGIPVPFSGLVIASMPERAPDLSEIALTNTDLVVHLRLAVAESFEDGTAGFSGNGDWEWGVPTYPKGLAARSGTHCWATDLHDDYYGYEMYLTSPQIVIPEAETPRLAFWHWHSIGGPHDGINVTYSRGSTFRLLTPIGGYTDPSIYRLNG